MSSVNWGGNHGSAKCCKRDHIRGVNLLKHCDQTFRSDPTRQHSNIDIDPSKSYQNQNFTGMTWKESKDKWEKRLEELDKTTNTNMREDRVELTSLEMPIPLGMTNDKAKELFQDFYDICKEKFGEENIISATSHFDEIAPYMDAKDGNIKVSRPHIHVQVVPEVNGKLNNKEFSSLANIMKMNQDIEKLCNEKYHIKFNTGDIPRRQTTKQLKRNSWYAEKLSEEVNQRQQYMKNILLDDGRTADDDFLSGGDGTIVNEEKQKIPDELVKQRDDAYRAKDEQLEMIRQIQEENERLKKEIADRDYKKKCIEKGLEMESNGDAIRDNLESIIKGLENSGREEFEFSEDLLQTE